VADGEVGLTNGRQLYKCIEQTVGLQTENGPSVWALGLRLTTPRRKNRTDLLGNHTPCLRTIKRREIWSKGERGKLRNNKLVCSFFAYTASVMKSKIL
jgi:hypothetical protein